MARGEAIMLLQFRVVNYRSFKEEACLDMTADAIQEHESSLLHNCDLKILPVAMIYGANAAGKTNFTDALCSMAEFVENSISASRNSIATTPAFGFLFSEHFQRPTVFEATLLINGMEYQYGFEATVKAVEREYLYFKKPLNKKYNQIFERRPGKTGFCVETGKSKFIQAYQKPIHEINKMFGAPTNLLLTALGKAQKHSVFSQIVDWFYNAYQYNCEGGSNLRNADSLLLNKMDPAMELFADAEEKERYAAFMRDVDAGISGFSLEERESKEKGPGFAVRIAHRIPRGKGKSAALPMWINSRGTLQAFNLYPALRRVLQNGGALVIDEIDAHLHPILLKKIISLFKSPETNPRQAQLICTLHNVILLDRRSFRRDEIWFVERNDSLESELYSLADIRQNDKMIRSDLDFCKHYLMGEFGAVPAFVEKGE